jgi:hypothetical protein
VALPTISSARQRIEAAPRSGSRVVDGACGQGCPRPSRRRAPSPGRGRGGSHRRPCRVRCVAATARVSSGPACPGFESPRPHVARAAAGWRRVGPSDLGPGRLKGRTLRDGLKDGESEGRTNYVRRGGPRAGAR